MSVWRPAGWWGAEPRLNPPDEDWDPIMPEPVPPEWEADEQAALYGPENVYQEKVRISRNAASSAELILAQTGGNIEIVD